jgi:hypothetical protein
MEQIPLDSGSEVPVTTDDPGHSESRRAMGETRRLSRRINLVTMTPKSGLASTTFCLADPGKEYVVYQPRDGKFTVDLAAGNYSAQWLDVRKNAGEAGPNVTGGGARTFEPPFEGAAVLHLKLRQSQ